MYKLIPILIIGGLLIGSSVSAQEVMDFEPDTQGVFKLFSELWNMVKYIWNTYLLSLFNNLWSRVYWFLGKQVEQRKAGVEEEFKKETQEMKEDIPKTTKSLWQRLKELID